MSDAHPLSRRDLLIRGGTAAAALGVLPHELAAAIDRLTAQEAVVPWLDAPAPGGRSNTLDWQGLTEWVTPTADMFRVGHYGYPEVDAASWRLEIGGLVRRPRTFTLAELRARPRREVVCTIECAGNRGFGTFVGAVHNARWTGTPLATVLEEAEVLGDGIEVVFFGSDSGEEEIRGNTVTQSFARSMSVADATDPNLLLAYEVNGEPLPAANGFPLRLVAPGWYGVASVKWLERVEVRDTRFMGRFMARDYVTLRQEERNGETVWTESSVGRARINSMPARVTRLSGGYRIHGAAWGAAIDRVEVRVDDGPWRAATLGEGREDPLTWTFWHLDWSPPAGEHTVTSRAVGTDGIVQPAPDDPLIAGKRTYWESNGHVTRTVRIG